MGLIMKLQVNIQNCYGIGKFDKEFDFSNENMFLIYAQNGIFKTSFAKTLKDIIDGKTPKDNIFINRQSNANVNIDNNKPTKDNLLVINSFDEDFNSTESVTTFMASKELKKEYDNIFKSLEKEKNELIKKLKKRTGSSDCEKELMQIFNSENTFYEILSNYFNEISESKEKYDFEYHDIFDDKKVVKGFLDKNIELLDEYINKYNELLSKSILFKNMDDGSFGTDQVNNLMEALKDNTFFKANHTIKIGKKIITSNKELKDLAQCEINRIISNKELLDKFTKIEKQIKNIALRKFKDIIQRNNLLLLNLKDYEYFRKKVFISFLKEFEIDIKLLIENYKNNKEAISNIIAEARKEQKKWKNIIDLFNSRFFVPFTVSISNQEEVILKEDAAQFSFEFNDGDKKEIDTEQLKQNLSMGEKKALYILQILFEIEAKKEKNQDILLIFDDIADSFDYRNKYAIIEYLNDMKELSNFKSIIMTHNFDFYRTLGSRLGITRKNIFMTSKNEAREINLMQGEYLKAIINDLKKKSESNNIAFISLIPFVRNLIEYTKGKDDNDYKTLTNCLHITNNTNNLKVICINNIINSVLNLNIQHNNSQNLIKDMIYNEAQNILNDNNLNPIYIENKIVLSISTRLKAEEFMINKLTNKNIFNKIKNNQTRELFKAVENDISNEDKIILQKVLMMSSENIHINSFMYEPILDTSVEHLKALHEEINKLLIS